VAERGKDCSVCGIIQRDLELIHAAQKTRPCGANTTEINNLKESDNDQWQAINELRKAVWKMGGGFALAGFAGSILGAGIITLLIHHFMK
jgi:hypothetical protein